MLCIAKQAAYHEESIMSLLELFCHVDTFSSKLIRLTHFFNFIATHALQYHGSTVVAAR